MRVILFYVITAMDRSYINAFSSINMLMKLDWKRLEKNEVAHVLRHVESKQFDELFKGDASVEITMARLPFYNNFFLYRFTTYATMPSLSLEFLGNGNLFYFLDGAPDPIYHTNIGDPINITRGNVLHYLDFFFEKVEGTEGDVNLILDPDNSPHLTALGESAMNKINELYGETKVEVHANKTDPSQDHFIITTPCYFEGSLVEATIAVYMDGQLDLINHKMLFGVGGFEYDMGSDYDYVGYEPDPYYG